MQKVVGSTSLQGRPCIIRCKDLHRASLSSRAARTILAHANSGDSKHDGKLVPASQLTTGSSMTAGTSLLATTSLGFAGVMGSGFNVEGPLSTLQAIGVLCAIVAVHEAGHFLAARLQGIHVTKFSIGMGPAIWTYKGPADPVEYSLRLFPIGGFVAFPDDTSEEKDSPYQPDDPDLLKNRGIPDRTLVISAGVIANAIFAYTVLFGEAMTVGLVENAYKPGVRVPIVMPDSAAERAGVKSKDIILELAGSPVPADPDSVNRVVDVIKVNANREISLKVERNGEVLDLLVTPRESGDGGRIGVQLASNADIGHKVAANPVEAAQMAGNEWQRLASQIVGGLASLLGNIGKSTESLAGPVAIVATGSEVARADISGIYQFCAIVNLNLAVVNLLPIPGLDGGYLFLIAIEALRGGKKIPENVERGIMSVGFLGLMVMGIGLVVKDTINLVKF